MPPSPPWLSRVTGKDSQRMFRNTGAKSANPKKLDQQLSKTERTQLITNAVTSLGHILLLQKLMIIDF